MISRLPQWVWVGGSVLAFVAGMVNVVGLESFAHLPVTHLTATTSRLAIGLAEADTSVALVMAGLIAAFFAGALFSGWLIRSSTLELGRHYETALFIESAALFAAVPMLALQNPLGVGLCCFASGLQNGLASTFSGAIVRTTHMTGLITDLGVHAGQILRGHKPDWRRLCVYACLIGGFVLGGGVAGLLVPRWHAGTLLVPAAIVAATATLYHFVGRR